MSACRVSHSSELCADSEPVSRRHCWEAWPEMRAWAIPGTLHVCNMLHIRGPGPAYA
jgi:hypothetical protein